MNRINNSHTEPSDIKQEMDNMEHNFSSKNNDVSLSNTIYAKSMSIYDKKELIVDNV